MALEQAVHAFSAADYKVARRLSFQAQLDARLAWKMTELTELRHKAASVAREAESLRRRAVLAEAR